MKKYFGYVRVSTLKQGQHGVSLQEQRGAIEAYATRQGLELAEWYEERETAAKSGRPVFRQMIEALDAAKADGVLIHKIDRSARNLRDWADLGELIDRGIEVHFTTESLDLTNLAVAGSPPTSRRWSPPTSSATFGRRSAKASMAG